MKKVWIIVGVFVLIGIIGSFMEDEPATKEEPKTEEVVKKDEPVKKEEPAPAKKEEPKPKPKEETGPSELLTETYLKTLQDSYKGTATVEYEERKDEDYGIFKITSTDPDVATAFTMIQSGEMPIQMWDTMTNSLLNISESMGNDYAVYLMNPANPDLVLFSAMGGVTIYNYMEGE